MAQDHKLVLPIAPADRGDAADKPLSPQASRKPTPPPVEPLRESRGSQEAKPKPLGLTMSRQWVLPPRPKPGRKPKPKPPKVKKSKPSEIHHQHTPNQSPRPLPQSFASPDTSSGQRAHATTNGNGKRQQHAGKSHTHDDDSCMLCSREDCMCETIGLKQLDPPTPVSMTYEPRKSLPTLEMILNGPPLKMDAVPLKRSNPDTAEKLRSSVDSRFNGVTKFSRKEDLQPLHPKHILNVPSPLEGLHVVTDSCGFCTENTPCACAEVASSSASPSPSTQHMNMSPMPMSPQPLSPQSQQHSNPSLGYGPPMVSPAMDPSVSIPPTEGACNVCGKDAMSMLFCLSLAAAGPLFSGSVSIPCHLAFKTLQKHPRFEGCDLGKLVRRLEVSPSRQVGVQSINRVLQDLERGEFVSH